MVATKTGSTLAFLNLGAGNTGTVSTTITVPADAEFVAVGFSGFSATANFFSGGGMTFTKGGADTAMTSVTGSEAGNIWNGALFHLVLPDTGTNKTLKWDWTGAGGAGDAATLCQITFWTGVDTASPVRGSGAGQGASNTPYTTGTITALTDDLLLAYVGAFASAAVASIATWSNLTQLALSTSQTVAGSPSVNAFGTWATGSPTGNTTCAASTDVNLDDGTIRAISIKPAAAAGADQPTMRRWGGTPGMTPGGGGFGRSWFRGVSLPARRPLWRPRRALFVPGRVPHTIKRAA